MKVRDHLNPAAEEVVAGEDGLDHQGEAEAEVVEEGEPRHPGAPAESDPETTATPLRAMWWRCQIRQTWLKVLDPRF